MKKRKLQKGQYWQNCPVCGDQKKTMVIDRMKRFKKYSVHCFYCGFGTPSTFTKSGARRKWNKATNVTVIYGK